jgi:hypothetical protein
MYNSPNQRHFNFHAITKLMDQIIGRIEEKIILDQKLATGDPELIAMYGRRRVVSTEPVWLIN